MKIKLLTPTAKVPTRGSEYAAGYDLYADETVVIPAGETRLVHLGFMTEMPSSHWAAIYPRSGLASKQGLRLANCVGVIDPDYRGEWMIALYNDSSDARLVSQGDRIAQCVIHENLHPRDGWEVVDEVSDTERGVGGFGSTGLN